MSVDISQISKERVVAKVYVDKAVYHIDNAFDYLVSKELLNGEFLCRGCRVLVPFGRANKKVQGLVCEINEVSDTQKQLKPIFAVLDKVPAITEEFFEIIEYMVKNIFCTHYEAVRCILPIGENVTVTERYILCDNISEEIINSLSIEQRRVVAFLRECKNAKNENYKTLAQINSFLNQDKNPVKAQLIKSLLEKGIIKRDEKSECKTTKKIVKTVRVSSDFAKYNFKLTQKQTEVIDNLNAIGEAQVKELAYFCGVSDSVVKNLVKRGILSYFEKEIEPIYNEIPTDFLNLDNITLSDRQQEICDEITTMITDEKPNATLLYGITGSGKTQIYIKLIERVLKSQKTAIMLVPEIALTPQLLAKFDSLFGGVIACIHSGLSASKRLISYRRCLAGQAKIVIGTRSAVFAPLQNIGLIIMDEEGENSYKSDSSPRYHARDIAKFRCVKHSATLLLASATPCVDSYYNAQIGKYRLFSIEERYANANLPSVYIVDMLKEQENKNFSPISELLGQQLAINLKQNEQSILLINRRGYNTYATCMTCGEVLKCKNCDVAMTYHKANGYMMCHYCGHTEKFLGDNYTCKNCNGQYIKLTGLGTQRLEDELAMLFPKARILRMDTDTTYSKESFEKSFSDFKAHKYDIMLGTQMIAKGLDFPNVTLVGVLNADSGLYSPDFHSGERIFSLITQVVGRSGRNEKAGRAYIQTNEPDNPIISFAANQDYKGFYEDEIFSRKEMNLPPFCDIIMLGFSGESENATKFAAEKALSILKAQTVNKEKIAMRVMGISHAAVYKISNKYRYRILIKCRLNNSMKEVISKTLIECGKDKAFSKISTFADVNGDVL